MKIEELKKIENNCVNGITSLTLILKCCGHCANEAILKELKSIKNDFKEILNIVDGENNGNNNNENK